MGVPLCYTHMFFKTGISFSGTNATQVFHHLQVLVLDFLDMCTLLCQSVEPGAAVYLKASPRALMYLLALFPISFITLTYESGVTFGVFKTFGILDTTHKHCVRAQSGITMFLINFPALMFRVGMMTHGVSVPAIFILKNFICCLYKFAMVVWGTRANPISNAIKAIVQMVPGTEAVKVEAAYELHRFQTIKHAKKQRQLDRVKELCTQHRKKNAYSDLVVAAFVGAAAEIDIIAERVFHEFDINKDGRLSVGELQSMLRILSIPDVQDSTILLIARAICGNSGVDQIYGITFEKFKTFVKTPDFTRWVNTLMGRDPLMIQAPATSEFICGMSDIILDSDSDSGSSDEGPPTGSESFK